MEFKPPDPPPDPPTISILLLGDPSCGKSTFLSRLSLGPSKTATPSSSPLLRDLDQPFIYDIRIYNRPYRFEFFDTASPTHYTLLSPDFVIICFDISSRTSLFNAKEVWRKGVSRWFAGEREGRVPVMLLGLKRDERREDGVEKVVYPQEGYRIAQEMRCDRYAECSAVTGELMNETFEDLARTAARTTTEKGGLSEGGCSIL